MGRSGMTVWKCFLYSSLTTFYPFTIAMTLKNICLVLTILLLFIGCAEKRKYSKTEMVEGIVTLDGVPVEGAEVIFYPMTDSGESATGKTDTGGHYTLSSMKGAPGKGTTAGDYSMTVSKWVVEELAEPYIDYAQDALIKFKSEEKLPAIYTDIKDSPLKATVAPGKNVIDLPLDSKTVSTNSR